MIRTYITVWASLLILLALTVGAAYIPLGPFNTITAISIAVTKAVIIALYFMHLRYSPRLTWVFAGAGFFFIIATHFHYVSCSSSPTHSRGAHRLNSAMLIRLVCFLCFFLPVQ